MKQRLEQFYAAFGDRGVMFILYAFSVVVNSLLTWNMELPAVFPDEISVAGIAAFYSGRDWSALLEEFGSGCGYIQALLYTPLFWIFKNPYALYKAMLIINCILISFIPLAAYRLAGKFGVVRVRYKLLTAICCGMYVAYVANSKFIWNESVTSLLGWLLVICMFGAWDAKSGYVRFALSLLLGFLCAAAYAANTRLLAVVAALVLTVILARLIFRQKTVNFPAFAVSLAISFSAEYFARSTLERVVWNGAGNAALSNAVIIPGRLGPTGNFFGVFFSHIYAFMTSSLGMGALALALSASMIFTRIMEKLKSRQESPEVDTKAYKPVKHAYSLRFTLFAVFQFLTVIFTSVFSALFTFGTGKSAEATVFGRYTDNLVPLAVLLVLVFVFLYGIDLKKLFYGVGIYGYACLCFAVVGYPLVNISGKHLKSPIPGLLPLRIGKEAVSELTGMSYIIMSSCVFTVFAVLIVFTSCSRKHRTSLISVAVLCVMAYTTVYAGLFYIPQLGTEYAEEAEPFKRLSELLYNDPQSPPIIVYDTAPELAAVLQFLAPDTKVGIMQPGDKVPESCLLIAENGAQVPFEGGSYDNVGKTDSYTVYAYGESVRDFIRYSSSKEKQSAEG